MSMIERWQRAWPALLIASGPVLTIAAIGSHRLWTALPWERFGLSLLLALLSGLLAWPLCRITRWRLASALFWIWFAALTYFAGPLAVLAVTLIAAAALAIGLRFVTQTGIALAVGLMAIAGATGWLLLLPVHHAWTWWPLLLAIVIWQRGPLLQCLRGMQDGWRASVDAAPKWAACAVTLLGLASTACWLPTMQADDLTYHLGLPYHLLHHARYVPMPEHQVWSFAPWAGDVLQGVAMVMSRQEARGALNALWIAVTAMTLWTATTRLSASARARWACIALFASFPPLVWLGAGMQTELPAMAVLIALAALLLPEARSTSETRIYAAAILIGGLAALKSMHLWTALPLLAYAAWQHRAHGSWRRLAIAVVIVVLIGGSSYWFAWRDTGNPVLPLLNSYFASPYFPLRDFEDPRWHAGVSPLLPWNMTVDTDRYLEAWDGGIGFTLLALAGAWVLALLRRDTRAFAIAAAATVVLPLIPLQYARYAFPGMVLLLVVVVPRGEALPGRGFAWMIASLCLLNLAFQANAGWTHHSSALKRILRSGGDAATVLTHYAPERMLIAAIPADDSSIVLATDPARGYVAELAGRGRNVSLHDPALDAARVPAETDPTGQGWRDLFASTRAGWIIVTPAASPALRKAITDTAATRIERIGDAELWRMPPMAKTP
ncbi:hypothetical protein [Luteimonas panaciterrae]|uniref:hypothetical protein n=1 Tax=Luteimonas panaciterrae TaxID=363885 RepID=UPI001CFA1C3F|nr:hypothetical protein [Luteimonas panaciterrae]